jgi:hypothetical protein
MNRRNVWSRLVGGLALSFMVAACAGPASPLAPDSAASFSGSDLAAATSETSHEPPDDFVETDTNPCTGEETEITYHFLQYVEHFTGDGAGGGHIEGSAVIEVTTADGFSGRAHFRFSESLTAGDVEQHAEAFSITVGNGTGQRIAVHGIFHIVIVDGEVVVDFESGSEECLGKPVA